MLLNKSDLKEALRLLAADAGVYVPGELSGVSRFVLWNGGEVEPDGKNTELPPKDILFPHTEKMYAFKTGADAEIREFAEDKKQIVFGVRPCDMASVERMDKVFLEGDFVDSFYARKRENTVFIALACREPGNTCFCDSIGLNPNEAAADVLLSDAGNAYYVTGRTGKGKEIVLLWKGLLKDGKKPVEKAACALKTKMSGELPEKLAKMFEHPVWDETGRVCIGCATCTYVCPTCYCFDIGAENYGAEGTAFRCWDSCMFSDYTRMAGGHDPRPTKKERIRNRYMHKLSYFNERCGVPLCVGCGRCVAKCPAHLDITEFIDKAAEVEL